MHFESQGRVVPMLCPGCATLNDIPDWGAEDFNPVIGCHRCGFHFPNLPKQFKKLTLHAMYHHRCEGPEQGDWPALGKAIMDAMTEQGEWPELPPWSTSW